jgi:LPS export ABC transporter permease LptG
VSALVAIGVLAKNNEMMVMQACGISLYRAAAPLLLFALATSALLFVLQERVLAEARREADRLERVIRQWPALTSPLDRRWAVGSDGSMYHYTFFDPVANRFSELHIYRFDESSWTLRSVTYARSASPANPTEPEQATAIAWRAREGWDREFSPTEGGRGVHGLRVKYTPFAERQLSLEPPKYFTSDNPDADMMTYGQLGEFISRLKTSGSDPARYQVARQRKIAFPLATLIMTLVAVPFAVMTGRRGAMYGVGAAVAMAIVYRIAESVFGAFGAGGLLPPTLAAWAPNLMFGAAAIYLILTVRT